MVRGGSGNCGFTGSLVNGSFQTVYDNCSMAHCDADGAGAIHPIRSLPVHAWCSQRRLILDLPFVDHAAKVLEEPFAAELVQCSQCQLSLAFCFICLNAEILSLVVVSAATMPLNTTMFSRFCPFFGKLNE